MLQVHTYLNAYASDRRASLPQKELTKVNRLYQAALDGKLDQAEQQDEAADVQRSASH